MTTITGTTLDGDFLGRALELLGAGVQQLSSKLGARFKAAAPTDRYGLARLSRGVAV